MANRTSPDELTCDAITADYRIFQRRRGHRYSLDDLATAFQATEARPEASRALDMGCGIGSVLLMVAWRLQRARVYGIEAQPISAGLARKSIAHNEQSSRIELIEGDLREVTKTWPHGACELVTGTPPYLPMGTAVASPDPQRAAARIELRGGVEDYLAAGARVLAPGGALVVCADGRKPERVMLGAREAGLCPRRRRDIWPRVDAKEPLFAVWTLTHEDGSLEHDALYVRGDDGEQTADARAMRAAFGL